MGWGERCLHLMTTQPRETHLLFLSWPGPPYLLHLGQFTAQLGPIQVDTWEGAAAKGN